MYKNKQTQKLDMHKSVSTYRRSSVGQGGRWGRELHQRAQSPGTFWSRTPGRSWSVQTLRLGYLRTWWRWCLRGPANTIKDMFLGSFKIRPSKAKEYTNCITKSKNTENTLRRRLQRLLNSLTELPIVIRASLARRSLVSSRESEKACVMWLQNSTEIPTACERNLNIRYWLTGEDIILKETNLWFSSIITIDTVVSHENMCTNAVSHWDTWTFHS